MSDARAGRVLLDGDGDDGAPLSPALFGQLRRLIQDRCGIQLADDKLAMVEGRLRRRLRALALPSLGAYCAYLFSPEGGHRELPQLFDVIATHKTDFFREHRHFEYLVTTALPALQATAGARAMQFWSAGCASGEEPYTLAMVLSEYAREHPGFRFRVLATDLSNDILERARTAVYSRDEVEPVPPALRARYLLRSKAGDGRHRVAPELRQLVEFRRLNLMDRDFGIPERMDAIFCRNVLIYFSRSTQRELVARFGHQLRAGGYLFLGHTETLHGMDLPFRAAGPTVHVKDGAQHRLRVLRP